jgi:hypothetical protein
LKFVASSGGRQRKGHWSDNANCRKFFCDLAASKGFDPFVPDNWKKIKYADIKAAGV